MRECFYRKAIMRKWNTALLVVAALALCVVQLLRAQPVDEFAAAGPKWEYARLVLQNGECSIETAEITRTAGSAKELYEKTFGGRGLNIKPFKNDSTLLTRIGGNGWEMTGSFAMDASRGGAVYVFKRPVR